MTAALEGGQLSAARPGRSLPSGKNGYPFYRRLGGPQGRSGRAEILVPTGIFCYLFEPIAVHAIYNQLNERSSISRPYVTPHLLFVNFSLTGSTNTVLSWGGVTYRRTKILTYHLLSSTEPRATPSTSHTVTPRSHFELSQSTRNRAHNVRPCTNGEVCPTSLALSSPSSCHIIRVAVAKVSTVSTRVRTWRAVSRFPLGAVACDHKSSGLTGVCHRLLHWDSSRHSPSLLPSGTFSIWSVVKNPGTLAAIETDSVVYGRQSSRPASIALLGSVVGARFDSGPSSP